MKTISHRERGQTLVIALIVLGVLLILAAVYGGILNKAIRESGQSKNRSNANDLAEAGIRFAHSELLYSDLGADWRGQATLVTDITRDPDAYYLRPSARTGGASLNFPGTTRVDRGGPDGLGAFFRVPFGNGRALIRVRYAPGDSAIFSGTGTLASVTPGSLGNLQQPGLARNYIIIESIGRPGVVNTQDPTESGRRGIVRMRNYTGQPQFETEYNKMREFDEKELTGRKLVAFAQIGLIDNARYITNKYKVSRPAEIGVPNQLGVQYAGSPVRVAQVIGKPDSELLAFGINAPGALVAGTFPAFGSMQVNADLRIHGTIVTNLNSTLGDAINVSGQIFGVDQASRLSIHSSRWNSSNWVAPAPALVSNITGLSSLSPNFRTYGGLLRDGVTQPDVEGFSRGVSAITAPTLLGSQETDGVSRYVRLSKDTGTLVGNSNSGLYGHGRGIYVDNRSDFQVPQDEQGRQIAGGAVSQVQDWLNPYGDGTTFRSGWRGPFYVPVGAFVRFQHDGFTITRNNFPGQDVTERSWRRLDGTDSGLGTLRYRFGLGTDGQVRIINALTPLPGASTINGALGTSDFDRGPIFDGIMYFEGNVRVRGVIPTDVQITLVSGRTIYIEGSLLKGIIGNDVTQNYAVPIAYGTRLTRPSRSSLMLMAKDYVTLNPTMFFGPAAETNAQAQQGGQGNGGYNPLRLQSPDGAVSIQAELPLDKTANRANPAVWTPLATTYTDFNGNQLPVKLILTHALEYSNPGPSDTFFQLDVNKGFGAGSSVYQFETRLSPTNSANVQWANINGGNSAPLYGPIYGLGLQSWQRAPQFESASFTILDRTQFTAPNTNVINATGVEGTYSLLQNESNRFDISLTSFSGATTGNYLLARAAMAPSDVRIEASIYAEDGSFFVIPGDWFNPNPNDTRTNWETEVSQGQALGLSNAAAAALGNQNRLRAYGTTQDVPFYGEPLDVKITLIGSIAENMPPPIAQQAEWLRKWGWIGTRAAANSVGANVTRIPLSHYQYLYDPNTGARIATGEVVPNITVEYDPALATGRANGFSQDPDPRASANPAVRFEVGLDGETRFLPPMPRLPVSPSLAYFGEIR